MKILFVSSEANPLVKVGGLADVVGSLPRVLRASGHDVRVIIPQYRCIDQTRFPLTPVKAGFKLPLLGTTQVVDLNLTDNAGVPTYILKNQEYFGIPEVYTSNDLDRFFMFSRAVFELLPQLDWQPDIVHCHDWHTALIPMWIRQTGSRYRTIFTIHNLAYQGLFDASYMECRDLKKDWDNWPPGAPQPPYSFMSQALIWSDLITTVSETYAREITTPEMGVGLDGLLRYRAAGGGLTGILNGLDYSEWDTQTDPYLPVNYDADNLKKRALNKIALQRTAGLPVNGEVPLIGMVQRLDSQKGIDIVVEAMEAIIKETGAQMVILGRGWEKYESMLRQISARFPNQVSTFIAFEEPLAHLIYAGSDMFLMPSRFEPCGLGQIIAMRYGAIPIVRHTGGLVDTVPKFSSDLSEGNGFAFHDFTAAALLEAVKEAVQTYKDKRAWTKVIKRVSRLDYSWQASARRYERTYQQVLEKAGRT